MSPDLIKPVLLDPVHDLLQIEAAPGGGQNGAAPLVPAIHHLGVQRDGLGGVEPAVPRGHAKDPAHAIDLPQTHDELPDHGVEPRAEAAAGDDGGPDGGGVEADGLAGPGAVVGGEARTGGWVGGGEIEEDVAEDDVGGGDVEAGGGVVEGATVDGGGESRDVREVVG